ncbi:MAG: hypothetical protein ABID04_00005, partial [Patescibacteria group bacterium]
LYGSIPKVDSRYPIAKNYYELLFSGSLGFSRVAQFSSYPCFFLPMVIKFCLKDDFADETFTVYDHPKVIIFENRAKFSKERIYEIILEDEPLGFLK